MSRKNNFQYFLYDNLHGGFYEIRDGSICGRIEGELTFPGDDVVSRKHCRFTIEGNDIYIEDLNSTNKTKVNTVPLRPGHKRRIRLNDVVEFGLQRFILTNQNKYAPPNTEDVKKQETMYKAVMNEDGALTSHITRFTKVTRILLDRYSFQKLRLRETLFPRKRPTALRPRIQHAAPEFSASIRKASMATLWVAVAVVVGAGASAGYLWFARPDLIKGVTRQLASQIPIPIENRER